jgi:hypothetical protein
LQNVRECQSWEECEDYITRIELENSGSQLLFRGQSDSEWDLSTTLERYVGEMSIVNYYRLVARVRFEIQNYSNKEWNVPDIPEILQWSRNYDEFSSDQLPAYSYLVHLRHHGFPSPLLDWSDSPYVAAYFALAKKSGSAKAAIFIYADRIGLVKSVWQENARIFKLGHYVSAHRRHFRQRSFYTYCTKWQAGDGGRFVSHRNVLESKKPNQDVIWKLIIPVTERIKILSRLDRFNLNAFSLFDSEDSLMETLAFREIDCKSILD